MYEIKIFDGHNVEVIEVNGNILFNPYNVGECLGLTGSAVRMSMKKMNAKQVVKLTNSNVNNLDIRKLHNTGENFLTESGVYKLVFKSNKENAERFQDWVCGVVLPSIRKHGAYMTEKTLEQAIADPDFLIRLATELKNEQAKRKELETKVAEDKPKVLFADAVETAHTSILVGDLAKLIKQNGVDIGQKRLFAYLRENGYLIKNGGSKNMPTQKSMEMNLFEVKERTINNPDGTVRITKTTKVTGKGQTYFINKFLGDKSA